MGPHVMVRAGRDEGPSGGTGALRMILQGHRVIVQGLRMMVQRPSLMVQGHGVSEA